MSDAPANTLYYGDNLDILRRYVKDETVDLVYLDPPFNSNATYNVLFSEQNGTRAASQIKAFEDTWSWDEESSRTYFETVEQGGQVSEALQAFRRLVGDSTMLAYLSMMAPRLLELRRVLKPTGSIYLHCDPTASHYLKLLLDAVFGPQCFRSEIVWRRSNAHNKTTRQYGPIHDSLLFYTKSDTFVFHPGTRPYSKGYIESRFTRTDSRGRHQLNYLTGPGTRSGESGKAWRGFDPTSANRHWAIPASLRCFLPGGGKGMGTSEQLEALFAQDLVVFPKKEGGQPFYKQYLGEGVPYQDLWTYQPNTSGTLYDTDECIDEDVKWLENEPERLGWETQKPLGLLERIIRTSTEKDAVVLDPFCGCGTAVAAAQKLGRRWIGIDITFLAIALIRRRLRDACGEEVDKSYNVIGEPVSLPDAKALAKNDPWQFQWWALDLVNARPADQKKGADKGIDGRIYFHERDQTDTKQIIISVKAGNTGAGDVRDLLGVVDSNRAAIGVLISMQDPTGPMREAAASAGLYQSPWGKHPRLQLLTVADLLAGKKIDCPPPSQVSTTFKKAARHVRDGGQQLALEGEELE